MADRFIVMFSEDVQLCSYLKYYLEQNVFSTLLLLSNSVLEAKSILEIMQPKLFDSYITKYYDHDILRYKHNIVFGTSIFKAKELSKGALIDGILVYKQHILPATTMESIYDLQKNGRKDDNGKLPGDD